MYSCSLYIASGITAVMVYTIYIYIMYALAVVHIGKPQCIIITYRGWLCL